MRIGFWNPFLSALGGGEKYLLTIMEEAVRVEGTAVELLAEARPDPVQWERLGVSIPRDRFEWIRTGESDVTARSADLDLLVVTTNDVPPESRARRSVAMIQFPHRHRRRPWRRALGRVGLLRAPAALRSYDLFLCNSRFTQRHLAHRLGVHASVLPPPVDVPAAEPVSKQPAILSVGRFFSGRHSKRQDVLIGAFAALPNRQGVELHLAGGLDRSDPTAVPYLDRLRAQADGLPVTFHVDAPRAELEDLYRRAAVYWHAAGFGQSERRHPERMEHFGITTVEAMGHGAVPLAYAAGGQVEIVEHGRSGVLWRREDELIEATAALLADPGRREPMARAARSAARAYGRERFAARVRAEVLTPGPRPGG